MCISIYIYAHTCACMCMQSKHLLVTKVVTQHNRAAVHRDGSSPWR